MSGWKPAPSVKLRLWPAFSGRIGGWSLPRWRLLMIRDSMIRLLVWLAILLLGIVPRLHGQDTIQDTRPPRGYSGMTFCRDGQVEMWVRDPRFSRLMPNPLDSQREWDGIQAHERTHVEQYQRYPTCELAEQAWSTSPRDSSLALEAEAYCAQAQVFLKDDTYSPGELKGRILIRLLARDPGVDVHTALKVLEHLCPSLRTKP